MSEKQKRPRTPKVQGGYVPASGDLSPLPKGGSGVKKPKKAIISVKPAPLDLKKVKKPVQEPKKITPKNRIIGYSVKPVYEDDSDNGRPFEARCLATGETFVADVEDDFSNLGGEFLSPQIIKNLRNDSTPKVIITQTDYDQLLSSFVAAKQPEPALTISKTPYVRVQDRPEHKHNIRLGTVYIPAELDEKLRVIAFNLDVSVSSLIYELLNDWHERKNGAPSKSGFIKRRLKEVQLHTGEPRKRKIPKLPKSDVSVDGSNQG